MWFRNVLGRIASSLLGHGLRGCGLWAFDAHEMKCDGAPSQAAAHLHRDAIGVVGVPNPDLSFASLQRNIGLRLYAQRVDRAGVGLDLLARFDPDSQIYGLATIVDGEGVSPARLERQRGHIEKPAEHIGGACRYVILQVFLLSRLGVQFFKDCFAAAIIELQLATTAAGRFLNGFAYLFPS